MAVKSFSSSSQHCRLVLTPCENGARRKVHYGLCNSSLHFQNFLLQKLRFTFYTVPVFVWLSLHLSLMLGMVTSRVTIKYFIIWLENKY